MSKHTVLRVPVEIASITYEIRRSFGSTAESAEALQAVCTAADVAITDCFGDSPGRELRQAAHKVRGAVVHGLTVLAELQAQAGRLEALAAVRDALNLDDE